jgi:hypothetical protein
MRGKRLPAARHSTIVTMRCLFAATVILPLGRPQHSLPELRGPHRRIVPRFVGDFRPEFLQLCSSCLVGVPFSISRSPRYLGSLTWLA